MELTREHVFEWKAPRFGATNPERCSNRFWDHMIRQRCDAYSARKQFKIGSSYENHKAKVGTSLWRRDPDSPVWCFTRFGRTVTQLHDGRVVYIGGEHEDWYDYDFCIYNDVVIEETDGTYDIYIYPDEVFPPTDFHTATPVDDNFYLIGNLGYVDDRRIGETQVLRLDTATWAIEPIITAGDAPGWLCRHRAEYDRSNHEIRVWGGEVLDTAAAKPRASTDTFALSLTNSLWRKVQP